MYKTGEDRRIILWNISTLPPTQTLSANPELDNGAGTHPPQVPLYLLTLSASVSRVLK